MDIRGMTMKKRSGFDVRKLTITIGISVSLAVIIQAHWLSGDVDSPGMFRQQAKSDAGAMAAFSEGESAAVRSETGAMAVIPESGTGAVSPEADGRQQVQGQGVGISGDEAGEIYRENPEQMVLVNRENSLSPSYDAMLRKICGGRLEASSRLYEDLQIMFADAADAGHTYWIASAYRSRERQQELIEEEAAQLIREGMSREEALDEIYRETMPAGYSEHETGLALDILVSDNMEMDQSQEMSAGNQWLRENCHKYGFVLRYPEDKSEMTGVDYEPWHFRYVGKRAARFLQTHGLTLEEFYQILE